MRKSLALFLVLTSCGPQELVQDSSTQPNPKPRETPPPSTTPPPILSTQVDEVLNKYVSEFKQGCAIRQDLDCLTTFSSGKLESVKMVDAATLRREAGSDNRVGVCYAWVNAQKEMIKGRIEILNNNGRGEPWDADTLRGVVFHELGHCVLGLPHSCNPVGLPACTVDYENPSMMWPWIYPATVYQNHWQRMVDGMFSTVDRMFSLALSLVSSDDEPLTKIAIE